MRLGVIPGSFQSKFPLVLLRVDRSFSKYLRIPDHKLSIQFFLIFCVDTVRKFPGESLYSFHKAISRHTPALIPYPT
jgi:hypothetical protein